jgi:hypothetical protein
MNRRTTLKQTGLSLLGLAIATLPHASFAQSDPFPVLWQLNLAKSKYSPDAPPKSGTVYTQAEGQNHKLAFVGIDAQGNPTSGAVMWTYDGMFLPVTRNPNYDAVTYTRVNAYTLNNSRTKAGKAVQTQTVVLSPDGKTATATVTGATANGQQINITAVHDEQSQSDRRIIALNAWQRPRREMQESPER